MCISDSPSKHTSMLPHCAWGQECVKKGPGHILERGFAPFAPGCVASLASVITRIVKSGAKGNLKTLFPLDKRQPHTWHCLDWFPVWGVKEGLFYDFSASGDLQKARCEY